jgi:hypothetical protein
MGKKNGATKSTSPRRYTGELATPIYEPVAVGGEAEAKRRAVERQILKIDMLFDWYSIGPDEPDAAALLAVKLAEAHVPGMRVLREAPKLRGRKRTWKDGLWLELVRDVDALPPDKKLNFEQAIGELRKDKEKPWRTYTKANLITRYREARKLEQRRRRIAELLMRRRFQAMGAILGMGPTDENSSDEN